MIIQYQKLSESLFCGMMYMKDTYGELGSKKLMYIYIYI